MIVHHLVRWCEYQILIRAGKRFYSSIPAVKSLFSNCEFYASCSVFVSLSRNWWIFLLKLILELRYSAGGKVNASRICVFGWKTSRLNRPQVCRARTDLIWKGVHLKKSKCSHLTTEAALLKLRPAILEKVPAKDPSEQLFYKFL